MQVLADENFDMNDPAFKAEWLAMMENEWEKDWGRDFGPAPSSKTTPRVPSGATKS